MSFGIESFGVESFGAEAASGASQTTLVIQDAAHAHAADNLGLTANGTTDLVVQDAAHAHAADSLTLSIVPVVDVRIAVIGQSNASGRGSSNQTAPASGAYLYANDGTITALADPWDGGTDTYSVLDDGASAGGSYIPRMAVNFDAAGLTTLWIPANKGTTTWSGWQRNLSTATLYGAMKARIDAAGGVDKIIIHLGETDATNGTAEATLVSQMEQLVADLISDFGCEVYIQKIHVFSGSAAGCATVRSAISTVWAGSSGAKRGADLDGITADVHFTTTANLNAVGDLTYAAIVGTDLVIADASHGHAADNVVLDASGAIPLTIADALHGHAVDAVILTADSMLVIADSTHAQRADSVVLSLPGSGTGATAAEIWSYEIAPGLSAAQALLDLWQGQHTPADVADAVVAKALGARTLGAHIQAIAATQVGETTGAGTSHMTYTDGAVTVEADVPLPGVAGDRENVVITGV